MDYKGVIIEESLTDTNLLEEVTIIKTRVEKVTSKHQTPWLTQWTLDTFLLPEKKSERFAALLSSRIATKPKLAWYVDFKNDKFHYLVFPQKIFKVDVKNPILYKDARIYGESLGIPSYQMSFERLKR